MNATCYKWGRAVGLLAAVVPLLAGPAVGQRQRDDDSIATRPLATRPELQHLVDQLQSGKDDSLLALVQGRLRDGDFQPGDRILMRVRAESTLSDTFSVDAQGELALPPPVVGTLPLTGVLRSELEPVVSAFIARFVQNPQVRAWALIRLSIQGEVAKGGVYGVPATATLGDALMAAGGTSQRADMRKLRIRRDGDPLWEGSSLQLPIDAIDLKDGDQIEVGSRDHGDFYGSLRYVWIVVSISAGIFGLSRALHH
jgi:protein involved in polysaccharide export with SLBB domain